MNIKNRIDELRIKKGWSLSKLAKEAGLTETTVYSWYNEKNFTPSRRAIEAVCEALDVSLGEFYSGIDESTLSPKQIIMLELFNQLSENQQDGVIDMLKKFSKR